MCLRCLPSVLSIIFKLKSQGTPKSTLEPRGFTAHERAWSEDVRSFEHTYPIRSRLLAFRLFTSLFASRSFESEKISVPGYPKKAWYLESTEQVKQAHGWGWRWITISKNSRKLALELFQDVLWFLRSVIRIELQCSVSLANDFLYQLKSSLIKKVAEAQDWLDPH